MTPIRCFVAGAIVFALGLLLHVSAQDALAQVPCGPADKVEAALVKSGSKLAADLKLTTDSGTAPMRIFANPKTGSWVLVIFRDDGAACLILAGTGWSPARLPGSEI